uniref:GST N-terminal domain-containing protein n=1 Tax=Steinernema glaseri TaxID=37863 RepID=A0A1I7ZI07_9BILA
MEVPNVVGVPIVVDGELIHHSAMFLLVEARLLMEHVFEEVQKDKDMRLIHHCAMFLLVEARLLMELTEKKCKKTRTCGSANW